MYYILYITDAYVIIYIFCMRRGKAYWLCLGVLCRWSYHEKYLKIIFAYSVIDSIIFV